MRFLSKPLQFLNPFFSSAALNQQERRKKALVKEQTELHQKVSFSISDLPSAHALPSAISSLFFSFKEVSALLYSFSYKLSLVLLWERKVHKREDKTKKQTRSTSKRLLFPRADVI